MEIYISLSLFVKRPTNAQGSSGFILLTRSKFFYPDTLRQMVAILVERQLATRDRA
jgi:hypothetical protein